jgi:hypothetical protein
VLSVEAPLFPGTPNIVPCGRLLGLVDSHNRGCGSRPLELTCCWRVTCDCGIDHKVTSWVVEKWARHIIDEKLSSLLVERHSLGRIGGRVTLSGERIELLVAVPDPVVAGVAGPERAQSRGCREFRRRSIPMLALDPRNRCCTTT